MLKLYIVAAALAFIIIIGLWPTLSADGASPATQPDGYDSGPPWPSEQNGDIVEARAYNITDGTLIMLRYDVGLDYQSKSSADRKAVSDLEYAGSRTQIVIYDVSNSADDVSGGPEDVRTGRRVIIGAKSVADFVNRGYSRGFLAMYFADEIYTEIRAELVGLSDPLNPITLAYATPALKADLPDFVASSIEQDTRNMLKSVQSGTAWTTDGIELISTDNILTHAGENYLEANGPYIRFISPDLYEATLDYPPFRFADRGGEGAQDAVNSSLTGTNFQQSFRGLQDWTGVPERTISTIVVILFGVGVAYFGMRIAESALVVIPVFVIVLAGGAMLGWVPMQLIAIMGVMSALIVSFLFFLKRVG